MTQNHMKDQDGAVFSALLTPNRSLGPRGFILLMSLIGIVSFVAGVFFWRLGAWPVPGFFGLDVLLVYLAFKLNYRAGRLYETVELTKENLTVTRVFPSGKSKSWDFNPYWVKLSMEERRGTSSVLSLRLHGKRVVFASFLSNDERLDFCRELKAAIGRARGI